MNVGLSNLSDLKAWLLAPSIAASSDYDSQIAALGKGVASQLEAYCNRHFARAVAATFEIPANRIHVVLPRYPLEAAPTIEQRDDLATGYVAQTYNDLVLDHNLAAGLISFGFLPGPYTSRLKFTFTGGYFFEPLEPGDAAFPTAVPVGSAALPDGLLLAWQLQCEHVWAQRDKLGAGIAEEPSSTPALAQIELLVAVKDLLRPFVRFSLT